MRKRNAHVGHLRLRRPSSEPRMTKTVGTKRGPFRPLSASLFWGLLALTVGPASQAAQRPSITYDVILDPSRPNSFDVTLRVRHGPPRVQLAMKVHAEYDARAWRYLTFATPNVTRADTTLWELPLAGGNADIRYRVRFPVEDV